MAETLAVEQVRNALGDSGDPPAWSNAELATRLDQNGGLIAVTVESCLLELQAEAAGRFSYTLGGTNNAVSDVFKQLDTLLTRWSARATVERNTQQQGATENAPPAAVPVEWWF